MMVGASLLQCAALLLLSTLELCGSARTTPHTPGPTTLRDDDTVLAVLSPLECACELPRLEPVHVHTAA